jgi:hypothetical protein
VARSVGSLSTAHSTARARGTVVSPRAITAR